MSKKCKRIMSWGMIVTLIVAQFILPSINVYAYEVTYDLENASGNGTNTITQTEHGDTIVITAVGDDWILGNGIDIWGSPVLNTSDKGIGPGGTGYQSAVTITVAGGKTFDLKSFVIVDIGGHNQSLKITTSKGSSSTIASKFVDYGWKVSPSESIYEDITYATITTDDSALFGWGFDNFVLDINIAPPSTPDMSATTDSGISSTDNITSDTTPTFTGTALPYGQVTLYDTNGTTEIGVGSADDSGNWSIDVTSELTSGSHTVTAKVTDSNNITSGASTGLPIIIDTSDPTVSTVTMTSSNTATTLAKVGDTVTLNITASESIQSPTVTIATHAAIIGNGGDADEKTWTASYVMQSSDTTGAIPFTLNYSDLAGNAGTQVTTVSSGLAVTYDTTPPTATIAMSDTSLKVGETATVTITFSEAVTGFSIADLIAANGTVSGLSSSDGGVTWTATFTPSANMADATNLIILNNEEVTDLAGNTGTGTTDSSNYTVDTTAPTATIALDDTSLRIGETATVIITFSEVVTGFTLADLTAANGTVSGLSSSDGGVTWTATFTPSANVTDATNLITLDNTGVMNGAGNTGVGVTNSGNYAIDTTRPTASIVLIDTSLRIGDITPVTITFSEAVTGFTLADLVADNGSVSGLGSSDGGVTWMAVFTPSANITDTTNLVTLDNTGITDLAGNAGTGITNSSNYTIDTVRPTASIALSDSSLTVGETTTVTITFSEAVTGFTVADMIAGTGSVSGLSSSDGGVTWTATFTPSANMSVATNAISLDKTGVADLAGNAGTGNTSSSNYSVDTTAPTATIVMSDTSLRIGEVTGVNITFSEPVTDFTIEDLTVANGTVSSLSSPDGGLTWEAFFTPSANITDTTNLITLDNTGVKNLAGNTGVGVTYSNNYAIDTARPTASIILSDSSLRIGDTATVTITFSEAVAGFTVADLIAANGTVSSLSSSDGGVTWTATFTPSAGITDATNLITVNNTGVTDAAGNVGAESNESNNYAIDTVRPTATVVLDDTSLKVGETATVIITFSEAVTGVTIADLTAANGSVSGLSSSDGGVTWTATFTPSANMSDATNVITLDNTGVTDSAGNSGTGTSNSSNYTVDTTAPTAIITLDETNLRIGVTASVTITFSDAVTEFTLADLTAANGSVSGMSSSDGGVTWTATFTPSANITDATNLITLDNTGVMNGAGNTGVGVTNSNNYAIDTARPTASIVLNDTSLTVGETAIVIITFSEAVTGFTVADLIADHGTVSGLSSSDGGVTWTVTFTPSANITDATNLITVNNTGVTDAAGNVGAGSDESNNYTIDTVRPTATIDLSDTGLKVGETATVTITFSEEVTGFTIADLTAANGTVSGLSSSDGGVTWTATFTPSANMSDATNVITLDNTGVTDLAGNTGTGTSDSSNYTVDTTVPTAIIALDDTSLRIGETATVTITFSESITGFTVADLTASNGTVSGLSTSDGGVT